MRVTDLGIADPNYRLWRKARTLLETLQSRHDWYAKHHPERLSRLHLSRLGEAQAALQKITMGSLLIDTHLYNNPLLKEGIGRTCERIFEGLPPPRSAELTAIERELTKMMKERSYGIAERYHQFTLACEIAYRTKHGYYLLFNTLTAAPEAIRTTYTKDSKTFTDYIRRVHRDSARASYGSLSKAKNNDHHTYFAAIESGSRNGRQHIHVIHFLKTLPSHASDPNYGLSLPLETNLNSFRRYWKHGRSEPRIVRYSPNDAYGKAGYRWPLDTETRAPLVIQSPLRLSTYLGGYIKESYNSWQRKKYPWRVRKTQSLGHHIINQILQTLSKTALMTAASIDTICPTLNNQPVPLQLIRQTALRILLKHHYSENPKSIQTWEELARSITPRLSPLHSLRASIQTIQKNSQQSTQYLSTLGYSNEDISNAIVEIISAFRTGEQSYFRQHTATPGASTVTDYVYTTT